MFSGSLLQFQFSNNSFKGLNVDEVHFCSSLTVALQKSRNTIHLVNISMFMNALITLVLFITTLQWELHMSYYLQLTINIFWSHHTDDIVLHPTHVCLHT